jgi:hypothetical protein
MWIISSIFFGLTLPFFLYLLWTRDVHKWLKADTKEDGIIGGEKSEE